MHYDDGFTFCKHVKESTQRCLKRHKDEQISKDMILIETNAKRKKYGNK